QLVFRHTTRPQALDEESRAVGRRGWIVDAFQFDHRLFFSVDVLHERARHFRSDTHAAASRSIHQTTDPSPRRMPAAGYLIQSPAPSSTFRSASAFDAPATRT